jgi:hypothetical protein
MFLHVINEEDIFQTRELVFGSSQIAGHIGSHSKWRCPSLHVCQLLRHTKQSKCCLSYKYGSVSRF